MNWNSIGEFLAMGGYASYVWGSLLMVIACLGGESWQLLRRGRAVHAQLRKAAEGDLP